MEQCDVLGVENEANRRTARGGRRVETSQSDPRRDTQFGVASALQTLTAPV